MEHEHADGTGTFTLMGLLSRTPAQTTIVSTLYAPVGFAKLQLINLKPTGTTGTDTSCSIPELDTDNTGKMHKQHQPGSLQRFQLPKMTQTM